MKIDNKFILKAHSYKTVVSALQKQFYGIKFNKKNFNDVFFTAKSTL